MKCVNSNLASRLLYYELSKKGLKSVSEIDCAKSRETENKCHCYSQHNRKEMNSFGKR